MQTDTGEKIDILACKPEGVTLRKVQVDYLTWVQNNYDNYDVFVGIIPVAGGKSVGVMTVAEWISQNNLGQTAVIAPNKMLQDQYTKDFEDLLIVKGASNYHCSDIDKSCEVYRKVHDRCCGGAEKCPYIAVVSAAKASQVALFNFHIYTGLKMAKDHIVVDECLPAKSGVITQSGKKTLNTIHSEWMKGAENSVLSFNERSREFEYKKVTNSWKKESNKKSIKIKTSGPTIVCTEDHKILTTGGYKLAKDIDNSDLIIGYSEGRQGLRIAEGDTLAVTIGSILGDGYWRRDGHCSFGKRLRLRHGQKQAEYIQFKAEILGVPVVVNGKSGYTGESQLIADLGYISDCGISSKIDALERLSPASLAIWFCDDGSIHGKKNKKKSAAAIHTESWLPEECDAGIAALLKMGIEAKKSYYRGYNYITINKSGTDRLVDIIAPYVPVSMKYKVDNHPLCGTYQWSKNQFSVFCVYGVKKILPYKTNKFVYDIEVEDNHNFLTKNTQNCKSYAVVHNCHNAVPFLHSLFAVNLYKCEEDYPDDLKADPKRIADWLAGPWMQNANLELEMFLSKGVDSKEAKAQDERIKKMEDVILGLRQFPEDFIIEYKVDKYWKNKIYRNKQVRGSDQEFLYIKPLKIDKIGKNVLWPPSVKKIFFLSATISDKDIEVLGLQNRRVGYFECESPIPAENRPFIRWPIANMSYATRAEGIPRVAEALKKLAERHKDEKGIVHCTYETAKMLRNLLSGSRWLFHTEKDKTDVYNTFRESKNPVILIASGMAEGIDLPDDAARWQVITQIMYPYLGDAVNKWISRNDPIRYKAMTIQVIEQQSGRIVRHPLDKGTTYCLDAQFDRLFSETHTDRIATGKKSLWHSWFIDGMR